MTYYLIWMLIFLCAVFMLYIVHKNIADVLVFVFLFIAIKVLSGYV